jgi:hypothetical protein
MQELCGKIDSAHAALQKVQEQNQFLFEMQHQFQFNMEEKMNKLIQFQQQQAHQQREYAQQQLQQQQQQFNHQQQQKRNKQHQESGRFKSALGRHKTLHQTQSHAGLSRITDQRRLGGSDSSSAEDNFNFNANESEDELDVFSNNANWPSVRKAYSSARKTY